MPPTASRESTVEPADVSGRSDLPFRMLVTCVPAGRLVTLDQPGPPAYANCCSSRPLSSAACAATAYAQAPPAPVNDHYLQSLRLNDPGRQLERTRHPEGRPGHHQRVGPGRPLQPAAERRPRGAHPVPGRELRQDRLVRLLPRRQRARADPRLRLRHGHLGRAVQPLERAAPARLPALLQRLLQHHGGVPRARCQGRRLHDPARRREQRRRQSRVPVRLPGRHRRRRRAGRRGPLQAPATARRAVRAVRSG